MDKIIFITLLITLFVKNISLVYCLADFSFLLQYFKPADQNIIRVRSSNELYSSNHRYKYAVLDFVSPINFKVIIKIL